VCPAISGTLHNGGDLPRREGGLQLGNGEGLRAINEAIEHDAMIVAEVWSGTMAADVEMILWGQERRDQLVRSSLRIERVRAAKDQVAFGSIDCGHMFLSCWLSTYNGSQAVFTPGLVRLNIIYGKPSRSDPPTLHMLIDEDPIASRSPQHRLTGKGR